MKIMFWNTNNNSINKQICSLAQENKLDLIILAEYSDNAVDLINDLASCGMSMKEYLSCGCQYIRIFGSISDIQPGPQDTRYSVQIINNRFILCAMHLPSQLNSANECRRHIIIKSIMNNIIKLEEKLETKNSILVGDINEDPYEDGCVSAEYFFGLPCRNDAEKMTRIIEGNPYYMFYNPMWNFFGDYSSPPGTYYYNGSDPANPLWRIFDQVLIRPCLIKDFVKDELKIATSTNKVSLLDLHGHPDKKYSDHLPIIFEIKEN